MKKKISSIVAISIIATNTMPAINVFADDVVRNKAASIEKEVSKNMTVETFEIKNYENFARYNEAYRVNVKSIANNGGNYPKSIITNAIDGKLETHWETGRENKADFKNEVEFEFENVEKINRLAYATRQDSARPKGYPKVAQILVADSDDSEYRLIGEVASTKATGDMVEFKFDTVEAKKVKFIFSDAHDGWASASEFWFYKEDKVLDSMERLFTNDKKNELNSEFKNIEVLNALENDCKGHPFYDDFKDDISDAKLLIEEDNVEYKDAEVFKFKAFGSEELEAYDEIYKIDNEHITNITTNGRHWSDNTIDKAIDGNPDTNWHSDAKNNATHTNEVIMTLDELQTLDKVVYTSQRDRGFAKEFEIYVSKTLSGDTFTKVTSGSSSITKDSIAIKFNPTEARRVKFVYKTAHEDWALASEFGLYKEDTTMDSMRKLFTDSSKSEVSAEFNTADKLEALENACKEHPFYNDYKEDLSDAKLLLEGNNVEYKDANVFKFKEFDSEELVEYNKSYKIDNKCITKITTNGRHWSDNTIEKAIDGDFTTNWHSNDKNSNTHTNEVIMTLDKLETLDKVVYTVNRDRGFAKQFEVYVSKTLSGDTFTKVTEGSASITKDSIAIQFNPTEARRVKFVFKESHEDWSVATEFGLYKPDTTLDKMDRLFTDDKMNKVSEEFGTLEELKALEDECKEHPFYNDFKEDLANAKAILENVKKESTVARTKKFSYVDNQAYLDKFRMPYDNIKRISNNGGQWSTMKIENAVDGKLDTYWETNTSNKADWKNEVTVEFKDVVTLNRIAYGARQSDRKGFLEEFEIYGSTTTKGDTFELIATAKSDPTTGLVEAKFEPTKFQRVKIRVTKSNQNWATLNELMFFKEDVVADKVYNLFTDNLMNELNPKFNSLEAVEALENEVKGHPISSDLMKIIDMAKDLLKSPDKYQSNIFELESRGDSIAESQKRKVWNFQDWQPTGIAVKSGEKIEVYVDAEPSTPLPKLVFKQMDSQHNGQVIINLSSGKNEITIPEVNSNELRPGTSKAGVLYTSNPYTTEQQIRNPKIRIVGGISYPHFIKGVDSDEGVMEELREYNEKLKADPGLPDVFDVFSDKTLVNVKATYALDWYTKNNKLPSSTADKSDEVIKETMKLWGFDSSSEVNSDFNFRYITMVKWLDNGGFMNAGNGITGFNRAEQGGALNVDTGWGFMHEMGHNFDTGGRTIGEVTNNILPLHFQRIKGERSKISEQNLWQSRIFPKVSKEDYSNNEWYPDNDRSLLTHLAPLWQLQLYDETFWPNFERYFRANNIGGGSWENIHEAWAVAASDVLKLNLTEHFARHGFYVSEKTAKHMEQYKAPNGKIWYLNDNKYLNKGEEFNEDVNCTVKPTINENSVKLDIAIDKANANSLLGYEIYRDGELIGFTDKETYVDTEVDLGDNHIYEVVPYSNDLNTGNKISVNSQQPVIETTGGVTVKLNEEFNPLDYVKSTDYQGNPIENIEVKHNVDNTKQGKYTVTYKVKDNNNLFAEETLEVEVVSDYTFLSDLEWTSATSGHQNARRNESIKGRHLGEPKTFDKGLATHANGVITYNLGEHDYDYLEMRVGVDMSIPEQGNSSITFKVTGNGKTLATTSVMKHADNLKYIKVPVKGVDEIKIEVNNGGNGITSDHGIIVEPKLATNNGKPTLKVDKSISVKVGEELEDVIGKIEAYDAEDGDLTKAVQISGQDKINTNRVGTYPITYTVTDKSGNTTTATRNIKVVNMEDFTYLSDYNWKSQSNNYTQAKKDVAINGGKLTLTGENNEPVKYEKGFGMHSTSTVIYDLTDKNADIFSTYIGVDRAMYNSVGQVQFEIYVDGELAYDSGIMKAKDKQKYIEINLADAKELKLVVKDGNNGNGSDHATFGDTKLHFVNESRIDKTELTNLVNNAKKLNENDYTEESFNAMQIVLAKAEQILEDNNVSQATIDNVTVELQESVKALTAINLDEVVNIPDKYLAKSLSSVLGKSEGFTIGDMRSLTELSLSGVTNLEGLQYAKNLVTIESEYNEVKDLRPLAKLEKLEKVNFKNQLVEVGELSVVDGVVKVNTEAYNRAGKNVAKKVVLVNNSGNVLNEKIVNDAKEVSLDVSSLEAGTYGVHALFEDDELNGILINIVRIK